jgi:hypothetical protein
MKFGRLTVTRRAGRNKWGQIAWHCRCDHGGVGKPVHLVRAGIHLRNGSVKSCSCLQKEAASKNGKRYIIDEVGKKYGRLTVIKYKGRGPRGGAIWVCKCDHGGKGRPKLVEAWGGHLRIGNIKSCGCLAADTCRALGKKARVHGFSGTRLYYVWNNMMGRCYWTKRREYKHYGGRGIKVYGPWKTPANFFAWAIPSGYRQGLTLERMDVNKGYNPNNCCWIRVGLQGRNKQKTVRVMWKGRIRSLVECCEMENLRYHSVLDRVARGWSAKDALTISLYRGNNVYRGGVRIHASST